MKGEVINIIGDEFRCQLILHKFTCFFFFAGRKNIQLALIWVLCHNNLGCLYLASSLTG